MWSMPDGKADARQPQACGAGFSVGPKQVLPLFEWLSNRRGLRSELVFELASLLADWTTAMNSQDKDRGKLAAEVQNQFMDPDHETIFAILEQAVDRGGTPPTILNRMLPLLLG